MKYWLFLGSGFLLLMLNCLWIPVHEVDARPLEQTPTPTPIASYQDAAHILYQQAHRLFLNGQIYSALNKYEQALLLYRCAEDRKSEAQVLTDLGLLHYELENYTEAFELLKQARTIQYEIDDRNGQITTLVGLSQLYETMGQPDAAATCYQQALEIYQTLEATGTLNDTQTSETQGSSYTQALAYYQQILALRQEMGDRRGVGRTYLQLGWIYHSTLQYADAIYHYQQALAIAREVEDHLTEAKALNSIGWVYHNMNQESQALQYFQQALTLIRQTEARRWEGAILSNIGSSYFQQRDYATALQFYQQAQPLMYEEDSGRMLESGILGNMGVCYLELGEYALAESLFVRDLQQSQAMQNIEDAALSLYHLGRLHFEQGQYDQALDFLEQAQQAYSGITRREGGEINVFVLTALIYEQQGDLHTALTYYQKAIAVYEGIRAATKLEEFKLSTSENLTVLEAYHQATRLHVELGQVTEAFELTEHARARVFLDQLGNARLDYHHNFDAHLVEEEQALLTHLATLERDLQWELVRSPRDTAQIQTLDTQIGDARQQYVNLLAQIKLSNPQYVSLNSIDPLTITQVQALLDDKTTLLSYFVMPEKTLGFVVTSSTLEVVTLPVSEEDLSAAIQDFRNFANLASLPLTNLTQLHTWLIAPLLPLLKTPLVGIVPYDTLHYLPFAALTDGTTYFGDQYTLFYLPSASVLPFIHQNRKLNESPQVLALAQYYTAELPALLYADDEVQAIGELYPTTILTGDAATESVLISRAGEYTILHMAAHGLLEAEAPLFSAIMLAPDARNDGRLEVREVYRLDLHSTDLVILSACQTQLGDRSQGDDIVGLNRAFIYAGASTVVASLWSVQDEATALLMERFYFHLQAGESKAAALQKAQIDLRTKYPHPYYWSAFVLTGDPGNMTSTPPKSPPGTQLCIPPAFLIFLTFGLSVTRRHY